MSGNHKPEKAQKFSESEEQKIERLERLINEEGVDTQKGKNKKAKPKHGLNHH
jgi:hypothetical protein